MTKILHLTPLLLSALGATAMAAPIDISMWRHESGDLEVTLTRAMIDDFNKSQQKYKVVYENLPKGSFTQSVTAAAVAKKLPCLIDMDQPTVANFAWSGHIRPIGDLVDGIADAIGVGGQPAAQPQAPQQKSAPIDDIPF